MHQAIGGLAVAASLLAALASVQADSDIMPTRRGDKYYVAAGKTYNLHANDHVRILSKYAKATGDKVPAEVIKEHTAAIRANVQQAQKSYAKLSTEVKQNSDLAKQLAEVQKRLANVSKVVDQLEAKSATDRAAEAKVILDQTAVIANELKATHLASKAIDTAFAAADQGQDEFEDRQSDNYYFTGEGHFID